MFQREPKLSFKLYSIQLPIIKTRSALICFNKNPSYLSSYIRFICQLSRQDLHFYVSTRTQAIFQTIFDSFANYQGKISTFVFLQEPKLSFKLYFIHFTIIKARSPLVCFNKNPSLKLSFKLYSIQLPIIKTRSPLLCFNENQSYLSSYIQFTFQLSRQDLCSYVLTRTLAIFQAIFDSIANYEDKIYIGSGEQELTWSMVSIK